MGYKYPWNYKYYYTFDNRYYLLRASAFSHKSFHAKS